MSWYPKWITCPKCRKRAKFVRFNEKEQVVEYRCSTHGIIRWINGKKFLKLPLPLKAVYNGYWTVFNKERLPPFWLNTLGIYQDSNGDIWYQNSYQVTFNKKTKLFRLYVDGKPIMVKEPIIK